MNAVLQWIAKFPTLRVLVVGEAILDRYLLGRGTRICREGPVPVISLSDRLDCPGGATNAAANIAAMGASATLLSVVGEDEQGRALRTELGAAGVATDHLLTSPARRTLTKHRLVSDGQLLVRFDEGTTEPVDEATEDRLIALLRQTFHRHDAVVVSDYAYGVLTERLLATLTELQATSPRVVLVDAKNIGRYRAVRMTAAKPNYEEVCSLLGAHRFEGKERAQAVLDAADELMDLISAHLIAVTLDVEGAMFLERGKQPYHTYAQPVRNLLATGAGDTFTAALTLALAAGAPSHTAADIASSAAAIVVRREGTTACSLSDLEDWALGDGKYVASDWELRTLADHYRRQGQKTVFTNGCFDILHPGHVAYLNAAKELGDRLIVGVNSDESVRRLKGPDRPINSVEDRIQVLAAMSCIDHIVVFDEDTPVPVIEKLKPDLFVKGGDYTREMLPEAAVVEALGGRVEILPYVEDRSTSAIVERIRGQGVDLENPAYSSSQQ